MIRKSGAEGIRLGAGSKYNIISGNYVTEGSQLGDMWFHSVAIEGSSYNLIYSNVIRRGALTNGAHSGLVVLLATSLENVIRNNQIRSGGTVGPLIDEGTNTVISEAHAELFMNASAASATHIRAAMTPDGTARTNVTSPDVPRNTMIRIDNIDTAAQTPSGGNIVIEGMDARGRTISETLVVPATSIAAGGNLDVFSANAFATVTQIIYYDETNAHITVSIGISNRIGLPVSSSNFDGVFRVARNGVVEAVNAVDLINGTVNLGTITTGDDFLIHYRVNLNIIR